MVTFIEKMHKATITIIGFTLMFLFGGCAICDCNDSANATAVAPTAGTPKVSKYIRRAAYVINVGKDYAVDISKNGEGAFNLAEGSDMPALKTFFEKAAGSGVLRNNEYIVVKGDPDAEMGNLRVMIRDIVEWSKMRVRIFVDDTNYLMVDTTGKTNFQRNPLLLLARLNEKGNLAINSESYDSIDKPEKFANRLKEVFNAREENGIYRFDSDEVEKGVFIEPDAAVKFRDVLKLEEVIRQAGSDRIGIRLEPDGTFPREGSKDRGTFDY